MAENKIDTSLFQNAQDIPLEELVRRLTLALEQISDTINMILEEL